MDRFKFRVWNIESKNFIYDAIYAYDGNTYSGKDNDGWICCFGEYIDRNNEYIVEQCTGLKDINGKLIYEGDIITDGVDMFEVVWDYNAWCIQTNKFQHFLTEGFEVIGNIHENKDLLEEK